MNKKFFVLVAVLCFILMVIGFFVEPMLFIVAAPLLVYNCFLLFVIAIIKRRKSAAEAADYIKNVLEDV